MLSSTPGSYLEALEDLHGLYVGRGYPKPLLNAWIKENRLLRWRQRLVTKVQSTANVLVLKTEFNPVWESFNVHELFDVIRKSWSMEYNKLPWCDLEGQCVLHNHTTLRMPPEIAAEVDNRLKSLYKHLFVGSATTGRSQRKRCQRSDDLTQQMLNDWVSDRRLTKRRCGVQDIQGDAFNAAASGSSSGTPRETVVMTGTQEKTVEDDAQTAAPEVHEPSPDVTVSCRFGASDLPRISLEDDRPASFLYS
jgi:hypothetical protein